MAARLISQMHGEAAKMIGHMMGDHYAALSVAARMLVLPPHIQRKMQLDNAVAVRHIKSSGNDAFFVTCPKLFAHNLPEHYLVDRTASTAASAASARWAGGPGTLMSWLETLLLGPCGTCH